MRKIVVLAAMLAVVAMAPQPAEAGDRGVGFRHSSPYAGAKFHRPHHGLKFNHRGFVGKHRHFKPRHFRHFGHGGLVLEFGDGDFVLKFGHIPHFKHHHFGHRHGYPELFFGFGHPQHFRPWHHRGFALEERHDLQGHPRHLRQSVPRSEDNEVGRLNGAAPPEALLKQLEQLGFRYVPELLSEPSR